MTYIEIRHFKLVKAIVESGSLTKAAQRLFLTQPAISHQLMDLEDKLETPLFHRTKKKMILTQAGEKLYHAADNVLAEVKQVELEISKLVHGEKGVLRIGTTCILSYKWLPSVMRQLQALYPKVDIELKTSLDVITDLKNGKLDVVITTMMESHPNFLFEPLFRDEIVIVMSPQDPLALKQFLIDKDFEGVKLISYSDPVKGDLYHDYLKPAGIEPAKRVRADQPEAALELVKSGFGISLFPKWAVITHLKSGALCARSFTRRGVYFEWKAIRLKSSEVSVYQRKFIDLILETKIVESG